MKDARSDAELYRVIAEWMGWICEPASTHIRSGYEVSFPQRWIVAPAGSPEEPPNYCSDLNSIHEAMQHMTNKQVGQFMNRIVELCPVKDVQGWWSVVNSTARQRAEAIVAVIEANK